MLYFSRWKTLGIMLTALTVACLSVLPKSWAQQRNVPSLMLEGGSYLVLEIDSNYVKRRMLEEIRYDARHTLREARIGYTGLSTKGDAVEVRVRDEAEAPAALAKLRGMSQPLGGLMDHVDRGGQRGLEVSDAGGGVIRLSVPEAVITAQLPRMIEQSIWNIENRIKGFSIADPVIQRQGADRILVQWPGLQDPTSLSQVHSGDDGRLDLRMVDTSVSPDQAQQSGVPPDSELLMSASAPKIPYVVNKQVLVSGHDIVDAWSGFDQRTNEPVVILKFNMSGARGFARARAENAGLPLAIVLNGKVVAAPLGFEPITGRQGQLSGNLTVESANDLAVRLLAGGVPAPFTVVEKGSVGGGLGQDSIKSDGAEGRTDPTGISSPQPPHRD